MVLTVTDDDATGTDTQNVTINAPLTVHVGDLDGISVEAVRSRWVANVGSVTFSVTNVTLAGSTYGSGANHEDDGDSDGTQITLLQP